MPKVQYEVVDERYTSGGVVLYIQEDSLPELFWGEQSVFIDDTMFKQIPNLIAVLKRRYEEEGPE